MEKEGYIGISKEIWREFSRKSLKERGTDRGFRLRSEITAWSLKEGIIPKVCPLCGNGLPDGKFEWHHWGSRREDEADRLGKCRRMCRSCNRILGIGVRDGGLGRLWRRLFPSGEGGIFSDEMTWEKQWEFLCAYYKDKDKRGKYPNLDGIEKDWSRLLPVEEEIYKKIMGRGSLGEG